MYMKRWEIYLEIFMELLIFAAIMVFIALGLPKLLAFFWPIVAAGILAMITNPIKNFLEEHLKLPKQIGATLMVILLLGLVSFVVYGVIIGVAEGVSHLSSVIPQLYQNLEASLDNVMLKVTDFVNTSHPEIAQKITDAYDTLGSEIGSAIASIGSKHIDVLGGLASSLTNLVVGIIVMFMSAYFLLIYYDNIRYFFYEIKDERLRKNLKIIKDNVLGSVGKYILSQVKLMFVIAVILCIGLLILGRTQPILLGFLISIVDAIPFLGTGTILCPWAAVCLIQGKYVVAVGLLVLYVICLLTRQILQPKIIGDTIGMNPFVTLILMYAGTKIAGLIGFILAVLIGIIIYKLYENGLFDGMIARTKRRLELLRDVD